MATKARPTVPRDVRWTRGRARFEGGAIVLVPSTVTEYSVLEEGEPALLELGAVRRPQDAVEFARHFGLLHHGPGDEDLREPWALWETTALDIHGILVTFTRLRAARRGHEPSAIEHIRQLTASPGWRGGWQASAKTDEERWMQVGAWLASTVSAGLAQTTWGIDTFASYAFDGKPGAPDAFMYSPRPADLLGWIYYTLAQDFVAGKPSRECEGCGVVFLVRDDRQQYHDKRCAQRARYHRAAEKRRQGR